MRGAEVWGNGPGDPLAPARWRSAADAWRARASSAGLTNSEVWARLPGGSHRFRRSGDTAAELARIGATAGDLDELAAEARHVAPLVFAASFDATVPAAHDGWHLTEARARNDRAEPEHSR